MAVRRCQQALLPRGREQGKRTVDPEAPMMEAKLCVFQRNCSSKLSKSATPNMLDISQAFDVAARRVRAGRPAKGIILAGGAVPARTRLLDKFERHARSCGLLTFRADAIHDASLPALLVSGIGGTLARLRPDDFETGAVRLATNVLGGFACSMRAKYPDIVTQSSFDPVPGLADNGDLDADLPILMQVVGHAVKEGGTALALIIDELHRLTHDQLGSLISATHHCAQRALPVLLTGGGPQVVPGRMGKIRSYSEHLFDFRRVEGSNPAGTVRSQELQTT